MGEGTVRALCEGCCQPQGSQSWQGCQAGSRLACAVGSLQGGGGQHALHERRERLPGRWRGPPALHRIVCSRQPSCRRLLLLLLVRASMLLPLI